MSGEQSFWLSMCHFWSLCVSRSDSSHSKHGLSDQVLMVTLTMRFEPDLDKKTLNFNEILTVCTGKKEETEVDIEKMKGFEVRDWKCSSCSRSNTRKRWSSTDNLSHPHQERHIITGYHGFRTYNLVIPQFHLTNRQRFCDEYFQFPHEFQYQYFLHLIFVDPNNTVLRDTVYFIKIKRTN